MTQERRRCAVAYAAVTLERLGELLDLPRASAAAVDLHDLLDEMTDDTTKAVHEWAADTMRSHQVAGTSAAVTPSPTADATASSPTVSGQRVATSSTGGQPRSPSRRPPHPPDTEEVT